MKNKKKDNNKKKIEIIKLILVFLVITLIFLLVCKYIYIYENIKFELKGNKNVELEVNSKYEESGFIAIVDGKNKEKKVIIKSNLNEKRNVYYVQEGKFVILSYCNKKIV